MARPMVLVDLWSCHIVLNETQLSRKHVDVRFALLAGFPRGKRRLLESRFNEYRGINAIKGSWLRVSNEARWPRALIQHTDKYSE